MEKGSPLSMIYGSISIIAFSSSLYNPLIPLFAQHLGATYLDLGLIGAAFSLPYLILPVFVGYLSDRFDRRYFYLTGIVCTAITPLFFTLALNVTHLIIIRLFGGIAFAFLWPVIGALVVDLTTVEERVKAMGRYGFSWAVGSLVGPAVGGLILERYGFLHLFVMASVSGALATAIAFGGLLMIFKSKPVEMRAETLRQKISKATFIPIYLVTVTHSIALGLIFSIFPAYANSYNTTSFQIGVLFAVFGVSRTLVFLQSENISKIEIREAISLGLIIQAISLTGIAYLTSLEFFIILMALMGSTIGIFSPLTLSTVSKMTLRGRVGVVIGFTEAFFGMGMTIGPFIGGVLAESINASSPYIIVAALSVFMIIPIIRWWPISKQ